MNQEQQAIEFGPAAGGVRNDGPVICLGVTFENDEARRAHFTEELRQKLKDPEFRKIEGFPIGEDEDILNLSDPPYYTACPNPWIADFIAEWDAQKPEQTEDYHREPFAADVSEGKNDPIYNAHSYHTKVPHKAIMRYILHYTEPGDIVFDGFCGTGMTGVATQLCGDDKEVETLGYRVKDDGNILNEHNLAISTIGQRRSILSDLSPIATFIARNYVDLSDLEHFKREAIQVVDRVEKSLSWLYLSDSGSILNAIWSDVFLCPYCSNEIIFWEAALKNGKMQRSFPCPDCGTIVGKSASKATGVTKLERAFDTNFDSILNRVIRVPKFILVEQTVSSGSKRMRVKISDADRKAFNKRFENRQWPNVPTEKFFRAGKQIS